MKICFLVLAHDQPELCARLVRRLLAHGDGVALHLDAKASPAAKQTLDQALGPARDEVLWADRVDVGWGEWSMVEATLGGLRAIRRSGQAPDYVYLLSGADYPIRPLQQLHAFLAAHPGVNFIESVNAEEQQWVSKGAQRERYLYRHWFSWKKHPRLHNLSIALHQKLGLERRFPQGLAPHMGSQWWTLTWPVCEAILDACKAPGLKRFFRRTWVADELFFQTLVRKVIEDQRLVDQRHLTLYQFSGHGVPLTWYDGHQAFLARQPFFFARKISPHATKLRDELDELHARAGRQAPPDHDAVGQVPDDYARFLQERSQGLEGTRSMLRVRDSDMGDLEWNTRPYFVLLSESAAALHSVAEFLNRQTGLRCHGELMARDAMQFAGGAERCAGYGREDVRIRDMKPQNVLVDLLQEYPDLHTGYLNRMQQGQEPEETDLVRIHARDRNAHLVLLIDKHRPQPPWAKALQEQASAAGARCSLIPLDNACAGADVESQVMRLLAPGGSGE